MGNKLTSVQRIRGESFIDNLLLRIHLIIVMIRWTGLAPWEFEFPASKLIAASPSAVGRT